MYGLVGTSIFLKIASWVAKETVHFHIAQQAYFFFKNNNFVLRDTQ